MTSLTKDTPVDWMAYPGTVDGRFVIQSGEAEVFAGSLLKSGTAVGECQHLDNDDVADYLGVALGGGVAGETIEIRQVGLARVAMTTIAASDEGTVVYADSSGTADNSAAAITKGSTSNAPCGQIANVVDDAGDIALLLLSGDGFR